MKKTIAIVVICMAALAIVSITTAKAFPQTLQMPVMPTSVATF